MNINDITAGGWMILGVSALLIGLSKTGLPGVGILAIPLVALEIPARQSTGLLLPMLIVGDIFAVFYYHRHALWNHLLRLLPFAVLGIVAGYWSMMHLPDRYFGSVIGGVILLMIGLRAWQERKNDDVRVPGGWWFPTFMGLVGGVTTMLANAAGPILVIYLLSMRLPKAEFIGTGAWFFLLVNCLKVPFSANLGLIDSHSLAFNLALLPLIILGALVGIRVAKRVPENAFNVLVQVFAVVAALRLMF